MAINQINSRSLSQISRRLSGEFKSSGVSPCSSLSSFIVDSSSTSSSGSDDEETLESDSEEEILRLIENLKQQTNAYRTLSL